VVEKPYDGLLSQEGRPFLPVSIFLDGNPFEKDTSTRDFFAGNRKSFPLRSGPVPLGVRSSEESGRLTGGPNLVKWDGAACGRMTVLHLEMLGGRVGMTAADDKFSQKLASYREPIYRYVLSIVRDAAEAEDLTQETFLRAHAKRSTLDDPVKLSPWLYRIATNTCYDRFRQASYRNRPQSLGAATGGDTGAGRTEALADPAPRLDKVMEQEEMSTCVQQYLVDLSDPYRAAILLHDVEGLTNPEIAEMLGVPLSTVKIRLHRAREKLRAALSEGCLFTIDERGVFICEPKRPKPGR